MSDTLPAWRVIESSGGMSTVEFDLPDLSTGVLTIASRFVGTLAAETMIRQAVARREETRDQLREGF